jgi:hypothetical protein
VPNPAILETIPQPVRYAVDSVQKTMLAGTFKINIATPKTPAAK